MGAPKPLPLIVSVCAIAAAGAVLYTLRTPPPVASVAEPVTERGVGSHGARAVTAQRAAENVAGATNTAASATTRESTAPAGPVPERDRLLALLRADPQNTRVTIRDLVALVDLALADFSGPERSDMLHDIGRLAAASDLEAGMRLLDRLETFRDRHTLMKAIIETAVAQSPVTAADWAANLNDPALRDSAYQMIAMKWAASDVPAALAWAQQLADSGSRASAIEGLTWTWVQKDPKAVYEWAASLSDTGQRDLVLEKMAKLLAVQNPKQALDWALQFPEGPQRDQALHYAVFQWAAIDLKAAAAWSAQLKNPALQTASEVAIARSWSNQEAEGATAWAAEIRDPHARATALKTTLQKWAESNPAAAANWLTARRDVPLTEEIFASVTNSLATNHPTAVPAWLAATTDPALRAAGERVLAQHRQTTRPKSGQPKG